MFDNRPLRRAPNIMADEEGWSGGPMKWLCPSAWSVILTTRLLLSCNPTKSVIKSDVLFEYLLIRYRAVRK